MSEIKLMTIVGNLMTINGEKFQDLLVLNEIKLIGGVLSDAEIHLSGGINGSRTVTIGKDAYNYPSEIEDLKDKLNAQRQLQIPPRPQIP